MPAQRAQCFCNAYAARSNGACTAFHVCIAVALLKTILYARSLRSCFTGFTRDSISITVRFLSKDLQNDRDGLQEKMSEQILRISTLQSRLDEQRHRAEELHRQGTSDLTLKVYDLQTQLTGVQELLVARDKQIGQLKGHLEQSKQIIDRQECDLAAAAKQSLDDRHEAELRTRDAEIAQLKERMRTGMISKMALPDLMETMLSEKNDELDHLKEQLKAKQRQLQEFLDLRLSNETMAELRKQQQQTSCAPDGKSGPVCRMVSDFATMSSLDFDQDSDIMRKAAPAAVAELSSKFFSMPVDRKTAAEFAISVEPSPIEAPSASLPSSIAAMPKPRQINFSLSELANSGEQQPQKQQTRPGDELYEHRTPPPSIVPHLQREIVELQSRIESLTGSTDTEVRSLKLQLEDVQNEKSTIALELNRHRDAASQLKLEIAAKSQSIAELMNQKLDLRAELAQIRDQLQAADAHNGKFEELNRQFEANRKESDALFAQNTELQKRIDVLTEQLTKAEKDLLNQQQASSAASAEPSDLVEELRTKLEDTKTTLFEVMIDYEKSQLDVQELRTQLDDNVRPLDECGDIAASLAKELNYSAHLDSSILKAIESDEHASDEDPNRGAASYSPRTLAGLQASLQQELTAERSAVATLRRQLADERNAAQSVQQQDATALAELRQRLQAAVDNEHRLQVQLDDERARVDRLAAQARSTVATPTKAYALSRENSLLQLKSPPDSPARSHRSDAEQIARLQGEIRLLNAQSEREKERLQDTERVLEREKSRFEKELADRKAYGDRVQSELDRVLAERQELADELDAVRDRLAEATHEIDALEAERSARPPVEVLHADSAAQRVRLTMAERERDALAEKCRQLGADLERGAQREAQLMDALVRENAGAGGEAGGGLVPQQFLQKLASIAENTQEYRQMAQTLQVLTVERQALQHRVDEMEMRMRAFNRDELEMRVSALGVNDVGAERCCNVYGRQHRPIICLASICEWRAFARHSCTRNGIC